MVTSRFGCHSTDWFQVRFLIEWTDFHARFSSRNIVLSISAHRFQLHFISAIKISLGFDGSETSFQRNFCWSAKIDTEMSAVLKLILGEFLFYVS